MTDPYLVYLVNHIVVNLVKHSVLCFCHGKDTEFSLFSDIWSGNDGFDVYSKV